jgi:putative heme-binding domain-containing protein
LPREVSQVVAIVAEHLARGGVDGTELATLLAALVAADARLSAPVLEAFATHWPDDRQVQLPSAADSAIERLLADAPFEARGDLLRLARLWNAGNTAELQRQHSDALKAVVINEELGDEERLDAAQAWVRFDPVSDEVCESILQTITPETPQELLTGMLRAASESRSKSFGDVLVELYTTLLPQAREAVLEVLLEKTESTKALLHAIAENQIEAAALSLEQIAALRSHPVEELRNRAIELIAERGATPNSDREAVLNELTSVTKTTGNAVRGRELFTQHCAVCHLHSGVGAAIGPELTGMFVHPKLDILTNILDPSRDVESNFRSYSVIAGGKVYTGMFAGQSRTTVTIVDSAGKSHVVQRDEIEELYTSEKSLMPDGFEKTLSETDLADVLEFLATPQQFVPLRMDTVATASSDGGFGRGGRGRGRGRRGGFSFLELADWKPRTVHGVPFTLIDPQEGAVRNMLMFPPADSFFARGMAREVKLPCGLPARRLHLLSGVSMGGYPDHAEQTTALIVRLHYEDGHTEDHELKNGVHFADFREREEVPESKFAFDAGRRQMRYLAIEPQRRSMITDVEFIKADDPTTPIVLAVTAELD